jgi:hypothetical protein
MIYVVEVDDKSLAFAAGSATQAAEIAGSPRFARAIGRACLTTNNQPRIATVQERVVFYDMSAEFAAVAADILVTRVG